MLKTAPSVARNKDPILSVLKQYLDKKGRLLEIGSGTGEHALYFSKELPQIQWMTSERKENLATIESWIRTAELKNIQGPVKLEIGSDDFPKGKFDYVFTANTLHIMSWKEGKSLFKLLGKRLREGSMVFFYGPFNYGGTYSSDSNRDFDGWLKQRNEKSGIRSFEDVSSAMIKFGFEVVDDHEMPANNRILVFRRLAFQAIRS